MIEENEEPLLTRMMEAFLEMRAENRAAFEAVGSQFTAVNNRLNDINVELKAIRQRLQKVEQTNEALLGMSNSHNERLDHVVDRLDREPVR